MSTQAAVVTAGVLTYISTIYSTERSVAASNNAVSEKISHLEGKIDSLASQVNSMASNKPSPSLSNLSDSIKEASVIPTDLLDGLFNTPTSFSISIILFVIAAYLALYGLVVNLVITKYSDRWEDKFPPFLKSTLKWYLKNMAPVTTSMNLFFIFISQSIILLLAIYMKFRGIA